jgi:hypothetical protein
VDFSRGDDGQTQVFYPFQYSKLGQADRFISQRANALGFGSSSTKKGVGTGYDVGWGMWVIYGLRVSSHVTEQEVFQECGLLFQPVLDSLN